VDDTHALVVFASKTAAIEAMKVSYNNIKLRPLSEAVKESKIKAFKCASNALLCFIIENDFYLNSNFFISITFRFSFAL